MALVKCKECGNEVSTKAELCPKCGAILKKKASSQGCMGTGFIILIVIVAIGYFMDKGTEHSTTPSSSREPSTSKQARLYKEGETASIGYTSYSIWKSWYSSRLSDNEFLDQKPDAKFLFVDLTVRNDDKEARSIPPFNLIDENGAEYETTSKAWAVDGSIGVLASLNPGVYRQGFIIFDVPTDHKYKLRVSGGFWSGESALIELSPKQRR